MPYYTLDDFINDRAGGYSGLDLWSAQGKPYLTLDEFTADRMGIDYKKYQDLMRYKEQVHEHSSIMDVLEQAGRGFAKEATFGFAPKLIGEEEPVGTAEKIARGVGGFAGFMAPLLASGGIVTAGGKALGLTTKLIKGTQYAKELAVLGRVGRTATQLGLASVLSDVPATVENPMGAVQRAKEGAVLGAIFGGAGLAHFENHKAISWMLRQFGGRAAMLATGHYGPETLDKDNLAQTVFSEALNTMFLHHGITPEMILRGKPNTPDQKALIEMMDADIVHMNEYTVSGSKLKIPAEMFQKKQTSTMDLLKIDYSVDTEALTKVKANIDTMKGSMRVGGKKIRPLRVQWNAEKGTYEAIDLDNEFLAALRGRYEEKGVAHEERTTDVRVDIIKDKVKTGPKLLRPVENAMRFYAPGVVNENLMEILNSTRYWKLNIDTNHLEPVPPKYNPPSNSSLAQATAKLDKAYQGKATFRGRTPLKEVVAEKVKIGPREILLERSEWDKAKARWFFEPVAKGRKVPSFDWGARKVFSRHVDDQLYKDLEGQISRMEQEHPGLLPPKDGQPMLPVDANTRIIYDNARASLYDMYKRNVALEEPINAQILRDMESGKIKKQWKGIDSAVEKAEQGLKILYSIPDLPLPKSYQRLMDERVGNLNIGMDLSNVKEALDIKGTFRVKHLLQLQEFLLDAEKLPVEDRIGKLFEPFRKKYKLDHVQLNGELGIKQRAVVSLENSKRKAFMAKALYRSKNEPGAGSMLKQLLTSTRVAMWQEYNKWAAYMQIRTDIPFHDVWRKTHNDMGLKKADLKTYTNFLNNYAKMPEQEQAGVYIYYRRLYGFESVRDIPLNERQMSYIKDVNQTMEALAPIILEERHRMWMDTVYWPEIEMTGKPVKPAAKAFPRQDDPQIREFLYKGAKQLEILDRTGNREPYDMWIEEAKLRQIGTIAEGVYLPEFVIKPIDRTNLMYEYESSNIGFIGKGHFKSREVIQDSRVAVDLFNSLAEEFRDKNLHTRLHAYINQVLNVKYVEPNLKALEDLVNIMGPSFKEAKPPGLGRKGVEAKGISLLDYFRIYAHRLKGYPIKIGPIGEQLRFVQSAFFRSLTVRPFLLTRNLPQRIVTAPHKMNVIDPRYILNPKYAFDKIPEAIQSKYFAVVSQLSVFRQDYLQLMESEKMKDWPFVGKFITLAEKVGNLYSISDEYNRRYVFSKTFFRSKDYINKYLKGEINQDRLDRELGVGKMESPNQRVWRELLQDNKVDEAAAHLAEWSDINTNWMYGRTEKSLPEMTGEGESFTNLLTWSKSVTQWMVNSGKSVVDGINMMSHNKLGSPEFNVGRQKMYDGAGRMVGLAIAGGLANALLNTVSFQVKPKFQSYGTDMFMWELGGVSLEIVKNFTDDLAAVVTSVSGTPTDRKLAMDKVMKDLDNVAIRQMLPFSKNTLAIVESMTGRSFISPLYEKWTSLIYGYPKQQTYVQRTMLEGVAHAIFATDPNKTEVVRKFVFKKMLELDLKRKEYSPSNPYRFYLDLMYNQYKRNNELLMRYTPMELLKDREQREWEQEYEKFKGQDSYNDWLYKSQQQQNREQRNYGQYQ